MAQQPASRTNDDPGRPGRALLRSRDFRLLASSEGFWQIGNQFCLIALPWLVLQLTGDTLALGKVLLLSGIPRVGLMVVGGALSDRFSPRSLMLGSNIARTVLLALLSGLLLAGRVELWMLYVFSLAYGLAEAFFYPARSAIVPLLVPSEQLQVANSITLSVEKLGGLLGPILAGIVIAWPGRVAPAAGLAPDLRGTGVALAVDALVTLTAALLLWPIALRQPRARHPQAQPAPDLVSSLKQGVVYVWRDGTLRMLFLIVAAVNLFTTGPLCLGLPALADARLAEGAAALGILTSALGAGALLGTALAGVLPKPAPRRLGLVLALVVGVSGTGLVLLGLATSTVVGATVALGIGAFINYINVTVVTWMQRCTPQALMGRMMSLVALR